MSDLLEVAVVAHGGLDRWKGITSIDVAASITVTFPDHIKSHTREQISCFGPDGLLRRQDYPVDILGGAPGLNYATDYREADGIVIPTKRRIYGWRATTSSSRSRC